MLLIQINQELEGIRLDKFLCQKFDISFALAQKLIREKKVKVNQKKPDSSYRIKSEDQIQIFSDLQNRTQNFKAKPQISEKKFQDFLAYKIFEDENLMAINKPSGLAVQGGSGIKISVDDFISSKGWQLVHRLDKDTSGILLIAKNSKTSEFLTKNFKDKTITKTYVALVLGNLIKSEGVINIRLKKQFVGKNEKVRPDFENGKEAITKYKLLKNLKDHALVELQPITGRTHQLRVHLKEIGHPIINDVKYGGLQVLRKNLSKRLCLHAEKIEISDYFGKKLEIKTEKPDFW